MTSTVHRLLSLVLVFALALVIGGCDDGSTTTSSGGGGSYEKRFAAGEGQATKDLAAQGKAAIPTIQKLLVSDNPLVAQMAAMTLKRLKEDGVIAVPALMKAFQNHPNNPLIVQTVKYKAYQKAVVPEIVKMLDGNDQAIKARAADLLNGMGDLAEPAVDSLLRIIESDASDKTKIEAMGAIASIGIPADERARPVLQRIVDAGGPLKVNAGRAIKRLDSAHAWKGAREANAADAAKAAAAAAAKAAEEGK